MNIQTYWTATLAQDADAMRPFFHPDACINWHNTNEHFTVEGFIRANCEYPGNWQGEILRVEQLNDLIITAVHVFTTDRQVSHHVTSFIRVKDDRIVSIDEFWGEDGQPPAWRQTLNLSTPII